MIKELNNRKDSIDIIKSFCAFFVVCIHCPFPGEIGKYIVSLARIAVPIFFMISGYFSNSLGNREKEKHQIKKLLKLLVIANVIYFLFGCLQSLTENGVYIKNIFTLKNLIKFVLFNESVVGGHLWYLGAIVYVWLIVIFFSRMKILKWAFFLIPFLLMIDIVIGKYSLFFWGKEFPYILVRNFMFVGLPYFLIGKLLYRNKNLFKKNIIYLLVPLFIITNILERYGLIYFHLNAVRDHYISTTFLAICLFIFMQNIYSKKQMNSIDRLMCKIGREYSTWIYIIHPIFIKIIYFVVKEFKVVFYYYRFIAPICVFLISIFFIWIIKNMINMVKRYIKRKR